MEDGSDQGIYPALLMEWKQVEAVEGDLTCLLGGLYLFVSTIWFSISAYIYFAALVPNLAVDIASAKIQTRC